MLREFKPLLPFAKGYTKAYLAGLGCLLVTDAGELYVPVILRNTVDTLNSGSFRLSTIAHLMGILLVVALVVAGARFGWRFFIIGSSRRIERDLREKLFSHLLTLSPSYFSTMKTGDLMARATNDMRAVRRATGMALVAFTDGTFLFIAIIVILLTSYGPSTLITIFPLPFVTILILFAGKFIRRYFKGVQEGFAGLSEGVRETFAGIRVIKAFSKEEYFKRRFHLLNENYKKKNMRLVRLWGFFFPLINFISGLAIMLTLIIGGTAVIQKKITPGDFTAIISYLTMLQWPVMGMGFTVNMLSRGAASMARINEILRVKPEITSPRNPARSRVKGTIEIRSLTFTFDRYRSINQNSTETKTTRRRNDILTAIDLTIKEGETLGILGRTGSGKSTLIRLLPRLTDPPENTVFINGIDIRNFDLHILRSSIGFVPQDTFLFSTTIKENIAFGRPNASLKEIEDVSGITTIYNDLRYFPLKWDTEVGERGVTLSGGQKQRIALARALLTDPPFLILDDSLSAVDTKTESIILEGFFLKRRGKTNILVSHRVSTLRLCDSIAVIDKGIICQKGTHRDLMEKEGFYREIALLQGEHL